MIIIINGGTELYFIFQMRINHHSFVFRKRLGKFIVRFIVKFLYYMSVFKIQVEIFERLVSSLKN